MDFDSGKKVGTANHTLLNFQLSHTSCQYKPAKCLRSYYC